MLGDSTGTLQKGGFGKRHEVTRRYGFSLSSTPAPPAPFAEAEQDLMESLDFFL